MFNKEMRNVVSKKDYANFAFQAVFYNEERSEYVATDARVMLIEHTDDVFESDSYFDPITGDVLDWSFVYPDYTHLVPETLDYFEPLDMSQGYKVYRPKGKGDVLISFNDNLFKKKQLETVLRFFGEESYESYVSEYYGRFLFKGEKKTAIVCFLNGAVFTSKTLDKGYFMTEEIRPYKLSKRKEMGQKYVFVLYTETEKGVEIKGVFSKKGDAEQVLIHSDRVFNLKKGIMY